MDSFPFPPTNRFTGFSGSPKHSLVGTGCTHFQLALKQKYNKKVTDISYAMVTDTLHLHKHLYSIF